MLGGRTRAPPKIHQWSDLLEKAQIKKNKYIKLEETETHNPRPRTYANLCFK